MNFRQVIYQPSSPGSTSAADFVLREAPARAPAEGEVLLQPLFLSTDPYLVRLLRGQGAYGKVPPGKPMRGRVVARVIASRHAELQEGVAVLAEADWAERVVAPAAGLIRLEELPGVPLSAYLGVLGSSGITAWGGLIDIARPEAGETVLVSAAAGAVGSVVGQLAKARGCRAVGIAGGADKVRHLVQDLGFDAAVDYKEGDFGARLAQALPQGADVYFENVGGQVFDTVLPHLNRYARIPLCGLASLYERPDDPVTLRNFACLLDRSVRLQAFRVTDYLPRRTEILDELTALVRSGRLRYHETLLDGLEQAPGALAALMQGRHLGKQLIRIS